MQTTLRAIGHRIPVAAAGPAAAFYRRLGFDVEFESEEYGWVSLVRGDFRLGLYVPGQGGGQRAPGGSVGFLLAVEDVDALHAEVTASGVEASAPADTPDGMRVFDVRDPDGNRLTFCRG